VSGHAVKAKAKAKAPARKRATRPQVTLKAALTLDGRMATHSGDSKWITGLAARREAHRMRAKVDAVLVGVGTVRRDDPELTVRLVRGRNPLRVVLDARLRTGLGRKVAHTGRGLRTLIVHGPKAPAARARALRARGVELCEVAVDRRGRLDVRAVLRALQARKVKQVLLEGGARVHGAFLDAGAVDRVAIFIAPTLIGDPDAIPLAHGKPRRFIADALRLQAPRLRRLGRDVLIEGAVAHQAPVASAPARPSAK